MTVLRLVIPLQLFSLSMIFFRKPVPTFRDHALAVLALTQKPLDLPDQAIELDRLGIVVVTSGVERLFAVPAHRVSRQPDYRHVAHRIVGFDPSGRLPT